jgi:hypothetical protein
MLDTDIFRVPGGKDEDEKPSRMVIESDANWQENVLWKPTELEQLGDSERMMEASGGS